MYVNISECFYWVSSYDLVFSPHPDGDVCIVTLKSMGEDATSQFKFIRHNKTFEIGQLLTYEVDNKANTYTEEFRHPALFIQENRLPSSFPIHRNFIGPVKELGMLRLMWLVQAKLSRDEEAVDYYRTVLHLSHEEETASKNTGNVIAFPKPA